MFKHVYDVRVTRLNTITGRVDKLVLEIKANTPQAASKCATERGYHVLSVTEVE